MTAVKLVRGRLGSIPLVLSTLGPDGLHYIVLLGYLHQVQGREVSGGAESIDRP